MDFLIEQDIKSVIELTGTSVEELASKLGVTQATVSRWINSRNRITDKHLKTFYEEVYRQGIRLNKIKEQFYREEAIGKNELLLFHGAKTKLEGALSLNCSKRINDFGNGFYCSESLESSAMFVATHPNASLYMLKFRPAGLIARKFSVNREWMLMVAYFRGKLKEYANSTIIKRLLDKNNRVDYIVAPIADNRMFEIIDSFIEGEITDVQCQHCLSATNLGYQYVFISKKALNKITILERCYLAEAEKHTYLSSRQENFLINLDKVKLAKKQYRNCGKYIEDLLK